MSPFYFVVLTLNGISGFLRSRREDRTLLVCACCETHNAPVSAYCKKCGDDYLIVLGEFKRLQNEAWKKSAVRDDARRTLRSLQSVRQCPACGGEHPEDHARCTQCGMLLGRLDAADIFTRMRRRHGKVVRTPEDVARLDRSAHSGGRMKSLWRALTS